MQHEEECPITVGFQVSRGWFKSVKVGEITAMPVRSGNEWIVPVRYTNGKEATLRYTIGPMRANGLKRVSIEEVSSDAA